MRTDWNAPVRQVIFFEDRAQVLRQGRVEASGGLTRLRVGPVSPLISDRTLGASLLAGPDGARVIDLRVRRTPLLAEEQPPELAALEQQLRQLGEARAALVQRLKLLELEAASLRDLLNRTLQDAVQDAGWNRRDRQIWQQQHEQLLEQERQVRDQLMTQRFQGEELDRQLGELRRQRELLEHPSARITAELELELLCPEAGTAELTVRYLVPNACWRPQYRACLLEDGPRPRVAFEVEGCVWQNTGEDFQEIEVCCSTQRPTLGAEPPLLEDDVVIGQRKQESQVVEAREQEIRTAGLGGTTARPASELPGIDDGGEPLLLRVSGPATLRSDGRPHRLPILRFESDATLDRLLVPELREAAVLRGQLTNQASAPLLAGPVDLLRSNGLVGRTSILYVAPGEQFSLSYGPDPVIRVQREEDEVEQKSSAISRWLRTDHHVRLHLSNLGAEERTVELQERIPVSEVESVRILYEPASGNVAAQPDGDGLLRWTVRLPPDGTAQYELHWALEKRKDVVGV